MAKVEGKRKQKEEGKEIEKEAAAKDVCSSVIDKDRNPPSEGLKGADQPQTKISEAKKLGTKPGDSPKISRTERMRRLRRIRTARQVRQVKSEPAL